MKHSELPIGFHPIRNIHVERALTSRILANVAQGMAMKDAEADARSAVVAKLPSPTFSKLRAPRPSKSDAPAYRKLNPARAMAR